MLLLVGFPPFNWSFLAWAALVPLFLALSGNGINRSLLMSSACGAVFFLGIFNWILEVPGYTLVHHAMLAVYLGSYFALFGWAFAVVSKRWGIAPALFFAPFAWVSLEYVRSNLSFLALPWGLLAHSQHQQPAVIQIAALTGAYGVSLLVVMVNSALTGLVYLVSRPLSRWGLQPSRQPPRRQAIALVVAGILLTVATLVYGHATTSQPFVGDEVKISVVQGNIEQEKKWDQQYERFIMETYAGLTEQAAEDRPALIIWPETATPRAINRDRRLYGEVREITQKAGIPLLLGSSQRQKFRRDGVKEVGYRNSAFLLSPDAGNRGNQRYDKIRLLPFGEYLPLKETIPWSLINIPEVFTYKAGESLSVFELPPFRFGVTICWENIFPDLVRQLVMNGAQFIVNITNEAWFGKSAAPYQFVSMNVFRAVENRVYVVRCANTGVSCFIDPYGRVAERLTDGKGQDIFIRGVLTGAVVPARSTTFYGRYGDWLTWLSVVCSVAFLLVALLRKNRDKPARPEGLAGC